MHNLIENYTTFSKQEWIHISHEQILLNFPVLEQLTTHNKLLSNLAKQDGILQSTPILGDGWYSEESLHVIKQVRVWPSHLSKVGQQLDLPEVVPRCQCCGAQQEVPSKYPTLSEAWLGLPFVDLVSCCTSLDIKGKAHWCKDVKNPEHIKCYDDLLGNCYGCMIFKIKNLGFSPVLNKISVLTKMNWNKRC